MARIRIAKATTGAAFVSKKKAVEARIAARESGQEVEDFPDDIFELQHHHLLRCLEKTTVINHSFYRILFSPQFSVTVNLITRKLNSYLNDTFISRTICSLYSFKCI